jgi:FixJ family two-component response regulator
MSKGLIVAVVDDDEPFRMALLNSLDSLGYGARGFASAEEFIDTAKESSVACIITDIHMPGMSGFDFKELLVSRGLKVPVIMITARVGPELEARAKATGAVCLLHKPFETRALIECLDTALKPIAAASRLSVWDVGT